MLLYLWRIGVCVAQLAIIVFVFAHLQGRTETIVVAILGLLYVTIRALGILQGLALINLQVGIDRDLVRIQELVGERREIIEDRREANKAAVQGFAHGKMFITNIFLGLVGLLCLFMLFGTLLSS